jgi:hypothetical protein
MEKQKKLKLVKFITTRDFLLHIVSFYLEKKGAFRVLPVTNQVAEKGQDPDTTQM